MNTRLQKVADNNWHGAIFAAAGLERIHLRPKNSVDLDWMLPAPAQGAIMVVCREDDAGAKEKCLLLHDELTAMCTKAERDFLRALGGGCSTPVAALAEVSGNSIRFRGNVVSMDGRQKIEIEKHIPLASLQADFGTAAAKELLMKDNTSIIENIRHAAR